MRYLWILFVALFASGCTDLSPFGSGSINCGPDNPGACTRQIEVTGAQSPMANGSFAQVSASEELVGGSCFSFDDPEPGICHYFVSAAFSWSSSNPSVATIDARGVLHALAAGSVTVTATDRAHNTSGTLALDVIRITTVRIAPAEILLVPGDARPFAAAALSGTDSAQTVTFAWSSSNPAVLTVDSTGLVTAIALGKAAITATAGDTVTGISAVTVAATGALTFSAISAGWSHTCGVASTGRVYCWGADEEGQLGNDSVFKSASSMNPIPVPVNGTTRFSMVSAGSSRQTCALAAGGAAWCWGANDAAQLGDGTTVDRDVPVAVAGGVVYADVSSRGAYACATTSDGSAACWGANDVGQLGAASHASCQNPNGGSPYSCATSPVPLSGGLRFSAVTTGYRHACGITVAGDVYCWGSDNWGQLGSAANGTCSGAYDTVPCSTTPVKVSGGLRFTTIQAADDHTCALSTSGKAYCWGLNNQGQLGVPGTDTAVSTPEPVTGGMIFVALSAGAFGNCALTAAGDAYCWGGYIANVPALVPGGHVFRTISSGGDHACALTALGVGYCWGSDDSGQLGIGPTNYQPSVPLRVVDPQ